MVFSLLLGLLFSFAQAENWISVEPDHFNLLYSEGERANVLVRVLSKPSNPDFQIQVEVEHVGTGPALTIDLNDGVGVYQSAALEGGAQQLRIVTKISGPDDFSTTLEEKILDLTVNNSAL